MNPASALSRPQVWHEGETALQETVGAAERMAAIGPRVIRDFMSDQHRDFYGQLPFAVAGSVDGQGDAWATLLAGRQGFISSPTPTSLDIDAAPDASDPARLGMDPGDALGLLGIEPHTRRRNRVNGVLRRAGRGVLGLEVHESFGNCPKYIQSRDVEFVRDLIEPFSGEARTSQAFDQADRDMIARADTFFVASYADREDRRRVDVSHRGGKPGFVRVGEDGALTIPDFSGNQFFMTLGNMLLNGKAGLVFVDFETGDLLQMTGDAEVALDAPEIGVFQGAERFWTFRPRRIVRRAGALPLRWTSRADVWSPFTLRTGDWSQSA